MPLPERHLETARLALLRASLTGVLLVLLGSAYSWLWSHFDIFRLPGSAIGPDWVYAAWCGSLALGFPLVTAGERVLGPLRAKHLVILGVSSGAFAFLWGQQHSHLAAISEGKGWGMVVESILAPLRHYAADWRNLIYPLRWSGTLAVSLLLLLKLRRARVNLLAQALAPAILATSLDAGLRLYDFHRTGLNIQISFGTFYTAFPKGMGCAAYALVAAWSDHRDLKACKQAP